MIDGFRTEIDGRVDTMAELVQLFIVPTMKPDLTPEQLRSAFTDQVNQRSKERREPWTEMMSETPASAR